MIDKYVSHKLFETRVPYFRLIAISIYAISAIF